MTAALVRLARPDEREALIALQWRASLANPDDRRMLLAHPDAIDLPAVEIEAGHVLTAELDGTCAGFAAILPRDDGDMELDGLFVEPALWKRGVGRALVEHCGDLAREAGATTLHVVGNQGALGFYQSCGFETVGPCATRFGEAVLMRKPL